MGAEKRPKSTNLHNKVTNFQNKKQLTNLKKKHLRNMQSTHSHRYRSKRTITGQQIKRNVVSKAASGRTVSRSHSECSLPTRSSPTGDPTQDGSYYVTRSAASRSSRGRSRGDVSRSEASRSSRGRSREKKQNQNKNLKNQNQNKNLKNKKKIYCLTQQKTKNKINSPWAALAQQPLQKYK